MRKKKRSVSAGTVIVLSLTAVVLVFSGFLWFRLRSGETVDLSNLQLPDVVQLQELSAGSGTGTGLTGGASSSGAEKPASGSAGHPSPAESQAPAVNIQTMKMTAAGTLAIEKNLRQSAYASDTKLYDFSDMLTMLHGEIDGDLNTVFTENLMMDDVKVSDTVVPTCAADLPLQAGFAVCMAGYKDSWSKKQEGVNSTLNALRSRGLTGLGIFSAETENRFVIRDVNGFKVAMMQYTDRLTNTTLRSLKRESSEWAVPEANAETIAGDLSMAREAGAEICIVYLQWGKSYAANPSQEQRTLAQQIADSGADLIIGAGNRVAQKPEYLTAADGRQVLCAWSLGTLMSDERSNVNRIGGILLHLTFRREGEGKPELESAYYTPTYVWRYRQDSHYYYKAMTANSMAPDGMDSEQIRLMEKTLVAVRKAMEGSPVTERHGAEGQ